jgi:hypothetical protein
MSEQQTRIEITGNIVVHHPVKEERPSASENDWLTLQESLTILNPQEWRSRYWNTEEAA